MSKVNHLTITTACNIPNTNLTEIIEVVLFDKYFSNAEDALEYARAFKKVNRDFQVLSASYNISIY